MGPAGNKWLFTSISGRVRGLAFDNGGNLYAANEGWGQVWRVSSSGQTSLCASGLGCAQSLAFDSSGDLYVATGGYGDNRIKRIDAACTIHDFATVDLNPVPLNFDLNGFACGYLLSSENHGGQNPTVIKVDGSGNVSRRVPFPIGEAINGIAVPYNGYIYVTHGPVVRKLDANLAQVATITGFNSTFGIAASWSAEPGGAGYFSDGFDAFSGWTYVSNSPSAFITSASQLQATHWQSASSVSAEKSLQRPVGPSDDFRMTVAFNSGPDSFGRVGGLLILLLTDSGQVVAQFDWHDAQAAAGYGGMDFYGQNSTAIYRTDPSGFGTECPTFNGIVRLQRQGSTWTAWTNGVQGGAALSLTPTLTATRVQVTANRSPSWPPATFSVDYLSADSVTVSNRGTALRHLPVCGYVTGVVNSVCIDVTPPTNTLAYAAEEVPPVGWTVTNITQSGQWDAPNGKVKWGPFFDNQPRTLCYSVIPRVGTTGVKLFSGTASFDGMSLAIGGDISIDLCIAPPLPADVNGDFRLVINEVTGYGAAWKRGDNWPNPPNPIPIDYVTWAGYLWKNGECYAYDSAQSPPLCWILKSCSGLALAAGGSKKDDGNSVAVRTTGSGVVVVSALPDASVSMYAVEELLPPGLTPYGISENGSWDTLNRKVKWGPFFDHTARTFSYKLGGTARIYQLSGVGSYDGRSGATTGGATVVLVSSLKITATRFLHSDQGFLLVFPTQTGRRYYIEFSGSLSDASWQIADGPLAGTGQLIQWEDDGTKTGGRPGNSGARYYRVRSAP